jgi:hypothetical protein
MKARELRSIALLMRSAALQDGSGTKVDESGIKVDESGWAITRCNRVTGGVDVLSTVQIKLVQLRGGWVTWATWAWYDITQGAYSPSDVCTTTALEGA